MPRSLFLVVLAYLTIEGSVLGELRYSGCEMEKRSSRFVLPSFLSQPLSQGPAGHL